MIEGYFPVGWSKIYSKIATHVCLRQHSHTTKGRLTLSNGRFTVEDEAFDDCTIVSKCMGGSMNTYCWLLCRLLHSQGKLMSVQAGLDGQLRKLLYKCIETGAK